jgi:hypothetical protein
MKYALLSQRYKPNSDTNETNSVAVEKTNSNATETTTTKNTTADKQKQNDVKSFTKKNEMQCNDAFSKTKLKQVLF